MTDELLTLDDIAAKVRKPRQYVRDTLVKSRGFPAPALWMSQKSKWWSAADFEQWLEKKKGDWAR